MSEADAERLSRVESVDEERARKALDMGDGDFDEARHLLRQAPAALKFRFASQDEDVYGLGILLLEASPPGLQELKTVVGNDRSLGTVTLSQELSQLKREINERSNESSTMAALGRRLKDQLKKSLSPPPEDWISLVKARNEADLQAKLEDLVRSILDEGELVLTAELDVGILNSETEESHPTSASSTSSGSSYSRDEVELLCDVKVSPVKGRAVQNLQPGEQIFVDLKEGQDNHRPLLEVIERLRDEQADMIPTTVDKISRTQSGKVEITVQFGENVFGKTIVGEDMNILTPESFRTESDRFSQLLSVLPWVLLGVALLTIGLLVLYALFLIP